MLWRKMGQWGLVIGVMVCGYTAPVLGAESDAQAGSIATVLEYREFPHGRAAYLSRLLVTPDYLRFDDGHAADDYLLFDRRNRTIYSVDHEDQTVLVIAPRPVTVTPPMPLKLSERHEITHGAPQIGGHPPVHYTFYVNGKRCDDVMAVPGLLDGVRKALMAYKHTLAGQQAADMDKTPLAMQSACSLANLIFAPTRMLAHGLPIIEWRSNGDRKELVNYKRDVPVSANLFRLPPTYRYYAIGAEGMVPAHAPTRPPIS